MSKVVLEYVKVGPVTVVKFFSSFVQENEDGTGKAGGSNARSTEIFLWPSRTRTTKLSFKLGGPIIKINIVNDA